MTKIMLVEDDNNLREIYEARLAAEGYEIVSAQDGEAALALAAKERPDLIVTDVMMPKISGFEMLDILRNTNSLRDVKIIMLTALGQAEDSSRANSLGADRYLVKSQVTLEDIVKAAHDVIDGPVEDMPETPPAEAVPAEPEVTVEPEAPVEVVSPEPTDLDVPRPDPSQTASVPPEPDAAAVDEPTEPAEQPTETSQEPPEAEVVPPESAEYGDTPAADNTVPQAAADPEAPENTEVSEGPVTEPRHDQIDLPEIPTESAGSAPAEPAAEASSEASQPVTDEAPSYEALPSEPQQAEQRPEAAEQAAIAEEVAETTTEEESEMRAKIDEFINNDLTASDTTAVNNDIQETSDESAPLVPTSEEPAAPAPAEPVAVVPDEPETEYEKDDQVPDMGQMAVHEEFQPIINGPTEVVPEPLPESSPETPVQSEQADQAEQTVAAPIDPPAPASTPAPETVSPVTGYPSQPYQMPVTPDAAIAHDDTPADAGNSAVSDAINTMIASTPGNAPAASGWTLPADRPHATDASQSVQSAPEQTQPQDQPAAVSAPEQGSGSVHSRVISPLGQQQRPDINQLLSMEEAKNSAAQAAASQPPAQSGPPERFSAAIPVPPPANVRQPIDPNSISL